MRDLNDKVLGGTLTADEWNDVPSEMQNIIEDLGLTLNTPPGDLDQLGKAIAMFLASGDYYSEGGSANAYVCSTIGSRQGPPNYIDGMRVRFRAGNANTGASTVNVNGIGLKNIKRENGGALEAGDIGTGSDTVLRYDAASGGSGEFFIAYFSMISESPSVGWGDYYIAGLSSHNTVGDITWNVNFGVGAARVHTTPGTTLNTLNGSVHTARSKKLDGTNFVPGTGTNGLANGATAKAANNWYASFLMVKSSDGTVDIGYDSDINASNLITDSAPDGFDRFRFIGWVQVNGANDDVEHFFYDPDSGLWHYHKVRDLSMTGSDQTFTLDIPEAGLDVLISINVHHTGSNDAGGALVRHYETGDVPTTSAEYYAHWLGYEHNNTNEENAFSYGRGVVRSSPTKSVIFDKAMTSGDWEGALRGFYVRRTDR
jgi:hypothetical protein